MVRRSDSLHISLLALLIGPACLAFAVEDEGSSSHHHGHHHHPRRMLNALHKKQTGSKTFLGHPDCGSHCKDCYNHDDGEHYCIECEKGYCLRFDKCAPCDTMVPEEWSKPKKSAEPKPKAKYEPFYTEKTMPAIAPAMQCVINLTIQFFLVYTAVAVLKTLNDFTGRRVGILVRLQNIAELACTTVNFAPMLCVLFLVTRMRAIQLTQGETEKYKLPQPWAQQCMFLCAWAVLGQVIMVLILPIFTGELFSSRESQLKPDADGNVAPPPGTNWIVAYIITIVNYLLMLSLYGGIMGVCAAAVMMEPPKEVWGDEKVPVAVAEECTMNLALQFFVIYLMVKICSTLTTFLGNSEFLKKLEGVFTLAKLTVNFAPMLSVLFIGARMRALQIDPKHGAPQGWAENCFYLCAYSLLVQCVLIILLPLCFSKCRCEKGDSEGDVVFVGLPTIVSIIASIIRYVALLALYGGFTAVMLSVMWLENKKDPSLTPPLSPAMQCVMSLTIQYFAVYLGLFVFVTLKQFTGFGTFFIGLFEGGQKTVTFAPMLAVLFIGTRIRALQLTKAKDGTIPPTAGPQLWAQQCMFLCTWVMLLQLLLVFIVPVILTGGAKPELDADGNVKTPAGTNKILAICLSVLRYLCLLTMYGGATAIVCAVFYMTPETLPPYKEEELPVPLF